MRQRPKVKKRRTVSGHKPDYFLMGTVLIIVLFGLIMLSSASSVVAFQKFGDPNYYVKHQFVLGILVGVLGFLIISKIDYHHWKRLAVPLLVFTFILLFLVFMPGVGFGYGGAKRWIALGGYTFQPSELAKLTFIIYLAAWLEKRGEVIKDLKHGLLPFVILLGSVASLIIFQPDMGTMLSLVVSSVAVFFVAGAPFAHLALIGAGGASLMFLLIKLAPYRAARLTIFLNPEIDPQGIGYHINQALLAIGSGGIFGLGLGHSRQKFNYLPEVAGDSIFAVIAEELGFMFSVLLIVLFLILMLRGFRIARAAPDKFGKFLAVGITSWFVFQALINIGTMTSILPLTGIPLPFISYGSSALMISLVAFGILINISRYTKLRND
ncbi:MAG: putative lipid II flippase FtsW [Patescibacteria group bacterium]